MQTNKVEITVVIIVSFLVGFLFGGIFTNYDIVKCSFYNLKITDVIQIIVIILIAFFITRFVNLRTSSDIKRKESVLELISKFHNTIDQIYELGYSYMNDPQDTNDKNITILLRNASIYLGIIENIKQKNNVMELNKLDCGYLKEGFWSLKNDLTNSPFKETIHRYKDGSIVSFNWQYTQLCTYLYNFRIYQ